MKSTPPVFHAPAASAMSTPNLASVSSPAVFNNGYYPWAVKTPEASPFFCGTAPRNEMCVEAPTYAQPLISRAFLKSVCEPFFDQMLTAVQEALEQQIMQSQRQAQQQQQQMQAMHHMQNVETMGDVRSPYRCQRWSPLDPLPDEESTDVDEAGGAFASLLSGPTSEDEGSDVVAKQAIEDEMALKSHGTDEDLIELEKSTMVCRHWKSKGWCRMEENCKFLHPENKRGVSAPKGGSKGSATSGGMSSCPEGSGISALECPADQLPPAPVGGRRKRRNRTAKEQHNNSMQDISDAPASGECSWNLPCTVFSGAGAPLQMNGCPFILYSVAPSA